MQAREAIDICNGTVRAPLQRVREAWQFLHDTRLAYNLQGPYAETCRSMLKDGMIEEGTR